MRLSLHALSIKSSQPNILRRIYLNTASAVGERQMLPRQTMSTATCMEARERSRLKVTVKVQVLGL
jgi:hypothetical protein